MSAGTGKNSSKALIICMFVLGIFAFAMFHSNSIDKEIEENKVTSIGKFSYCDRSGKSNSAVIVYYIENKKFQTSYGDCPGGCNEMFKKFYVIHYSSLNPKKMRVYFDQQVTDTVTIRREGFSRKEIERSLEQKDSSAGKYLYN